MRLGLGLGVNAMRRGAAWSPARLSGHLATYLGSSLGAASSSIASWVPSIGAGTLTAFGGTTQATVFASGGKKAMRLAESTGTGTGNGYGNLAIAAGAQTIALCCSTRTTDKRILQANLASAGNFLIQPRRGIFAESWVKNSGMIGDSSPHTVIVTKAAAGNWAVYFDGVSQAVNAVSADWPGLVVGGQPFFDEIADADVWAITVAQSRVSSEVADLHAYLFAQAP